MSSGSRSSVCPRGVFVVLGVVAEAVVQAADESVAQSPQGLVGGRPPAEDAALGVGAQSRPFKN